MSQKKNKRYYSFHEPVLDVEVFLLLDFSVEERVSWLKRRWGIEVDPEILRKTYAATEIIQDDNGAEQYIVNITDTKAPDAEKTLVHECFHLVTKIFARKGILHDTENHEVWSYYMEYWFEKFREKLHAQV